MVPQARTSSCHARTVGQLDLLSSRGQAIGGAPGHSEESTTLPARFLLQQGLAHHGAAYREIWISTAFAPSPVTTACILASTCHRTASRSIFPGSFSFSVVHRAVLKWEEDVEACGIRLRDIDDVARSTAEDLTVDSPGLYAPAARHLPQKIDALLRSGGRVGGPYRPKGAVITDAQGLVERHLSERRELSFYFGPSVNWDVLTLTTARTHQE